MPTQIHKKDAEIAILLFVSTSFLTWYLSAAYFTISLDEGIYTYGGYRIAAGGIVYKDFTAFVGPILYWMEGLLYQLFGNDLTKLRLSSAASIGSICTGAYFFANSIAGRTAGLLASLSWFAVSLDLPNRMEVNHRWLSMAFYALAGAMLIASPAASRVGNCIAGCLLGAAIFTTPSFVYPAAILGVYLFFRDRSRFLPYLVGGILSCSLVTSILLWQGALTPFLEQLRWAAENYVQANHFPFGRFAWPVPTRLLLQVYLGAICIPLSLITAGLYFVWRRDLPLEFPVVFCLALIAASYPKWDAFSLFFISAPYFGLAFAIAFSLVPDALRSLVRGLLVAFLTYNLINAWTLPNRLTRIPTRGGVLMGESENALAIQNLENAIPRKSKVFVYPYMSGLYTVLDVQNPTRFEFLQPGMMTAGDEANVLADLRKSPPDFIFWQSLSDEDIRRIWPSSNPDRHRFRLLEQWIREGYEQGLGISESNIRHSVWAKKR